MSSRIYKTLFLVIKIRSGLRELPVIKEGDRKAGRLAYKEQSGSVKKVLAIKFRTESCLQVYLPCLRYSLQLETMCCKVSDWRQKQHVDDWAMDHFERFVRVARVLFRYFRVKLKMFFIKLCWTFDQSLVVVFEAYLRIDDITNPCDVNSFVIRWWW